MSVLSVVKGDNGHLIAEAARLWIGPDDYVIDLTYGRGGFWTEYRPELFISNDLHKPATCSVDYRNLPADWAGFFDVVVFDPPYISTGTKAKSTTPEMYDRYGIGNARGWREVFTDIQHGIVEAERILKPRGRLLVKCMDYVESGSIRWGRRHVVDVAERAGLKQVDEFVHHSGTGPQPTVNLDGTLRRQVHSRRAHSFLCVFKKGNK